MDGTYIITKQQFNSYERVRKTGHHNMILDSTEAIKSSGLLKEVYFTIVDNYESIRDKFDR